jgi:hypothetical protein
MGLALRCILSCWDAIWRAENFIVCLGLCQLPGERLQKFGRLATSLRQGLRLRSELATTQEIEHPRWKPWAGQYPVLAPNHRSTPRYGKRPLCPGQF